MQIMLIAKSKTWLQIMFYCVDTDVDFYEGGSHCVQGKKLHKWISYTVDGGWVLGVLIIKAIMWCQMSPC